MNLYCRESLRLRLWFQSVHMIAVPKPVLRSFSDAQTDASPIWSHGGGALAIRPTMGIGDKSVPRLCRSLGLTDRDSGGKQQRDCYPNVHHAPFPTILGS
jgi:hypothetical protein